MRELLKKLKTHRLDDVLREIMVDNDGNTLTQGQFAAELELDDDTTSKGLKFLKRLCEKKPVRLEMDDVFKECAEEIKQLSDTIDGQAKYLRTKR